MPRKKNEGEAKSKPNKNTRRKMAIVALQDVIATLEYLEGLEFEEGHPDSLSAILDLQDCDYLEHLLSVHIEL